MTYGPIAIPLVTFKFRSRGFISAYFMIFAGPVYNFLEDNLRDFARILRAARPAVCLFQQS
jgi:hypothetical protein